MVATGFHTSYGIRSDGMLFSWGYNGNGELGDGTTVNKNSPVQIGSDSWTFIGTSVGNNGGFGQHTIHAIRNDGILFGWGNNASGQIGDETTVNKSSPVQIGSSSWTAVSYSGHLATTMALNADGMLFTWGGSAGLGDNTTVSRSSQVQIGSS